MTLNEEEFISYASDTPSEENPEVPIQFLNTLDVPRFASIWVALESWDANYGD